MLQPGDGLKPVWGARFNSGRPPATWDCPFWARPSQRDDWEKRGLLLWDHATRKITWISATHTLSILSQLRTTSEWREHGLVVGQPAVRVRLNDPEREAERVLSDEMEISPGQLPVVLELLETRRLNSRNYGMKSRRSECAASPKPSTSSLTSAAAMVRKARPPKSVLKSRSSRLTSGESYPHTQASRLRQRHLDDHPRAAPRLRLHPEPSPHLGRLLTHADQPQVVPVHQRSQIPRRAKAHPVVVHL